MRSDRRDRLAETLFRLGLASYSYSRECQYDGVVARFSLLWSQSSIGPSSFELLPAPSRRVSLTTSQTPLALSTRNV